MKLLIKKRCKCGTFVVCKRRDHGPTPQPVCGTCKKYGLEFSAKQNLNINRKRARTTFK